MRPYRIVAIHLLNDWSGSPLVFRQALETLGQAGHAIHLFTATPGGSGFLSDLSGVAVEPLPYRWSPNKLLTLLNYLRVQAYLFGKLLLSLRSTDRVYINTLLPFGAAVAGWLRGCSVTYHVHEVSLRPQLLRNWLRFVADHTAEQVLFVSDYTKEQTALRRPACHRLYNALPDTFLQRAAALSVPNVTSPFTALMLCSNKAYKGTHTFIDCARRLPHIRFWLVLNSSPIEVDAFGREQALPPNCTVFPAQTDTLPFYEQAHVVLNLSHPDAWIETFGMTILEAMACGRPVITPTVGGICELIENGKQGFNVSINQPVLLEQTLRHLSSDFALYQRLAEAARLRARFFSPASFRRQLTDVFRQTAPDYADIHPRETMSTLGNGLASEPSNLAR